MGGRCGGPASRRRICGREIPALLVTQRGKANYGDYAELSRTYLEAYTKLDTRGGLPEARRMVDESLALRQA